MNGKKPAYRRIILKISGEVLCPPGGFGIHREPLDRIVGEIAAVAELGVQVGVVTGGGNFMRGAGFADELGIDRAAADYMGMLATVLNAVALQEGLEKHGHPTRVLSALTVGRVCEDYDRRRALHHFDSGRLVLFAAGTGNPHVTTDSCASIRGVELRADAMFKGTKVDGVYDDDPARNPAARLYDEVSYAEVIDGRLRVMDIAAAEMCERYGLPVIVFNLFKPGMLRRIVLGERLGTRIGPAS